MAHACPRAHDFPVHSSLQCVVVHQVIAAAVRAEMVLEGMFHVRYSHLVETAVPRQAGSLIEQFEVHQIVDDDRASASLVPQFLVEVP